jgi:hypothetical protein
LCRLLIRGLHLNLDVPLPVDETKPDLTIALELNLNFD